MVVALLTVVASSVLAQTGQAKGRDFFPETAISAFEAEWYGKALVKAGEKPLLDAAHLGAMRTGEERLGTDGSEWILESAVDGKLHAVVRWTASTDTEKRQLGPFVRACEALYRASGLKDDMTNKSEVELRKTP
jgi:hypothetical protein